MKYKIVILIMLIIGIALAVGVIFTLIKYGNTPISEIPTWAYWVISGGR